MSYSPPTGVSPRFGTALELSDTCLCLNLTGIRRSKGNTKTGKSFHIVSFEGFGATGTLEVFSQNHVVLNFKIGEYTFRERCGSAYQAKRLLMKQFLE